MPMVVTSYVSERSSNRVPMDAYLRDKDKVWVNSGCPGCTLCKRTKFTIQEPGVYLIVPRFDRHRGNDRRPLLNGEVFPQAKDQFWIGGNFITELAEGDVVEWTRGLTWWGPLPSEDE